MDLLTLLDQATTSVVRAMFDQTLGIVVEFRSYLSACEDLTGEIENWIYRIQDHIV